jgi:hypothetical protein
MSGASGTGIPFEPSAALFKRLTASQFKNCLTDLLGAVTVGDVEEDTWSQGFATVGAGLVSTSPQGVELYQNAIDAATTQVFGDAKRRSDLLGCVPQGPSDTACFKSFISRFGRLAWRRTLTAAQSDRYAQLTSSNAALLGDTTEALRLTTNAILESPYFLYRLERGQPQASSDKWWMFTPSEMAGKLAFLLLNSTPDPALLDAVDGGKLSSADDIQREAVRLFTTTRGRSSAGNFASELFHVDIVLAKAKDQTLYPQYTPSLQAAIVREVPAMFEGLVFDQKASALDLLTTGQTMVNSDLAALYGLPTAGLTSTSWVPGTLPANGPRAGLLGSAVIAAQYAGQKEGSPTLRGKFIREVLLCQAIPPPPPNVNTVLADPPPGVVYTKREKLAIHRAAAVCSSCHSRMDPLGLTLENFDAIGGYRTNDQGKPIDVSGDLDGTPYAGPRELGQLLAKSDDTGRCMVSNLYRYATGRGDVDSDQSVEADLFSKFRASGYQFRDLILDMVSSDAFRFVKPSP